MDRNALIQAMDDLLCPANFQDYAPNGLQIAGCSSVNHIVTGVTASLALLNKAISVGADMVLVHHGYFWQGEAMAITGMKQQRIKTILANDLNLVAYHLPLDAHLKLGNNAMLAKLLGFKIDGTFANQYVFHGKLQKPMQAIDLKNKIAKVLNREPLLIEAKNPLIESIVWCTGGAQKYINDAADFGADAYLSGEISESTTHIARERNIHYFAAGHHATERYGVAALGEYLADKFKIKHTHIDIDNPV